MVYGEGLREFHGDFRAAICAHGFRRVPAIHGHLEKSARPENQYRLIRSAASKGLRELRNLRVSDTHLELRSRDHLRHVLRCEVRQ